MVVNFAPRVCNTFWTNVKPVCGKCKLWLWRVCILWICEFNKNNFLLVTTKSNKESIYCDGKGSIPSFLNNGRHVSRLLDFVITKILTETRHRNKCSTAGIKQNEIRYTIYTCWVPIKTCSALLYQCIDLLHLLFNQCKFHWMTLAEDFVVPEPN